MQNPDYIVHISIAVFLLTFRTSDFEVFDGKYSGRKYITGKNMQMRKKFQKEIT